MTTWNTQKIIEALSRGAGIALEYYEAPDPTLKSDRSIVTLADHAIEAVFGEYFDRPETGSYLIGEETVDTKDRRYLENAFKEVAWVVDPIDGTAPYAHHIPTWGISIARMEESRITDGAIYLPITDELFLTDGDEVLYGTLKDYKPLVAVKRSAGPDGMIALTQSVAKRGTFEVDNPIQALGCAVLPLAYLLLGRFLGYTGTVKLWDVAGALAMLTKAGFPCTLVNGTPLGTEVNNDVYHLDEKDTYRWYLRDRMLCGPSVEVLEYMGGALALGDKSLRI